MVAAASDIATYLRTIYQRVYGLAPMQRNRVLRICLAHRLKELPHDSIIKLLHAVTAQFSYPHLPIDSTASSVAPESLREAIQEFAQLVDGATVIQGTDELKLLRVTLQRLTERTRVLAETVRKPGLPLSALLERAARDLQAHHHALEQAASESFERVLSALNPETLKKSIPKKMLVTETAYKAALFDAVVEKFHQIEMYHNKGRLVRDYKSAYKKYVQEENSH